MRYADVIFGANAQLPPLAEEAFREWHSRLGEGLVPVLGQLYAKTDGTSGEEGLAMRLLRHEEVINDSEAIRAQLGQDDLKDLWAFWTDDNSNYGAVFLGGPLRGFVTFIDHEEPLSVPVYASAESYLEVLAHSCGKDWSDLPREYPRRSSDAPIPSMEAELKRRFLARYESDPSDAWSAHVAMQFFLRSDQESVRALLRSSDMWIQERASRLVGELGMEDLAGALEQVGLSGMHNGRMASIGALKKLGTERAKEALVRLKQELGPSFEPYFR